MALLPRAIADKIQRMLTSDDKQTPLSDTTLGKLLTVGSFGLGCGVNLAPAVTDANNQQLGSGLYNYNSGGGSINAPENFGTLLVVSAGNVVSFPTWTQQMFFSTTDNVWYRAGGATTGVWTPWKKIYTQGSVLGTVSQSGGVPTGAIIEEGSNANGTYTKFADGTMICHLKNSFGSIAANTATATTYWYFPAVFSEVPAVSVNAGTNFSSSVNELYVMQDMGSTAVDNDSTRYKIHNVGNVCDVYAHLLAIGRWF